jgi:dGTPase
MRHDPPVERNDAPRLRRRDRIMREAAEEALSPAATRSRDSRGRATPEEPDPFRTAFERDRDRIVHAKAFRRLKHKTQVFLHPDGDHFITRLTHTLQVSQIGRSLAAALTLNEPLAEAIALGHDVGHTPFGHTGEEAFSPYFPPGGWHHAAQSVRVFEVLENLNLSWEVLDGIRAHSWRIQPPPVTEEAMCIRFADRIAYLSHDALDAIRAGVLEADSFPAATRRRFGVPGRGWVGAMIDAVVEHSLAVGRVAMDPDTLAVMNELRTFMFEHVYEAAQQRAQQAHAIRVLRDLMDHLIANPGEIPESFRQAEAPIHRQAADYVAGMTDRFALAMHEAINGPTATAAALRAGVEDLTDPLR